MCVGRGALRGRWEIILVVGGGSWVGNQVYLSDWLERE